MCIECVESLKIFERIMKIFERKNEGGFKIVGKTGTNRVTANRNETDKKER